MNTPFLEEEIIRADIARGKLVKELETLRRRVAELEELQAERKRVDEERKKMKDALHISEAKYKDLYENAPIAHCSVGTDGSIRECNKAAQLWLGFSAILAILLVAVTLLVGCSRVAETPTPMNLEAIAKTFIEASDSGDIERCLSLLSDDVVFSQNLPGVKLEGKDQYEAVLREAIKWHEKHLVTSSYKVDGDKVTFTAKASGDDFSILGMDYINFSSELQIRDGKISSIIDTLDSADWAKLVQLNSGGIGVQLTFSDKGARVDKVAANSPADEAGIKPGDIITAVDGVSYSQMREGEIQLRIRGKLGSKVLLTVIREGVAAPIDIEVTRA